jgi:hypothetical protein
MMMEYLTKVSAHKKVSFPQRQKECEGAKIKGRKQEVEIS